MAGDACETADAEKLRKSRATAAAILKVIGWLYVVGFVGVVLAFITLIENATLKEAYPFLLIIGPAAFHFWVANALIAGKVWARVISIIIGVLLLTGFPLGTILGIFLLTQLLGREWRG